ncbi:MAG: right-handed parallel beta-helix repeat-containing protein, partial [Paludibacteraceae bacterium]|nr:right-handed parallel beta-helix repeat-containing protein [Paludibacteraceae bacterium]
AGSVEFTVNVVEKSIVILAEDAKENQDKSWTLSAYLEKTDCKGITEYGFVLCGSTTKGDCTPTYTSKDIILSTEGNLEKGAHFTDNVLRSQLTSDWYAYRAFVKHGEDAPKHSEIRYFSLCNNVFGDTIYVTIDNTLTNDSKCDFRFKSFENAWAALEGYKDICTVKNVSIGNKTQKSFTLLKPIVMQVVPTNDAYQGSEAVGLTGGDKNDVLAIFFRNINMNGGEPLIVRSIDKTATKATLLHVTIRRSKNITLDYLNITGSSKNVSTADNALDIDDGQGTGNREGLGLDWNTVTLGAISDAKITIKNCGITSYGFTCVHVSAYDGITFENNEIKALYDFVAAVNESHGSYTNQANNTAHWGASAKFLNSKNIKFVRNNFTGQHATSILLQGSQSVLVYNNVFWHDNGVQSDVNTVAIIRLVSYRSDNPLQNIGIYYNTMFLKDNTIGKGYYHHFDFFRLGGNLQNERHGNYKPTTIEFDYNNCYSYDKDVYGKNYKGSNGYTSDDSKTHYLQSLEESDWCSSFKYNNFWSVYEEDLANKPTKSAFELGSGCGTENSFTNVKNLVCQTAPEEPGSLVIKGDALNRGSYIQTDVSGLLTTDMQKIDRLGNDRPYEVGDNVGEGEYTIGAYQQSEGETLKQIIWHGSTSDVWDNRNNWYKPNGQLVTCVDIFDENLEVILPAPYSTKKQYLQPVNGIQHYPTLPSIVEESDFSTTRSKEWVNEEVTAGKGQIANPTQIAKKITMEYGAALIGVEQLAKEGKTRRYETVSNEFVAERDKWLLVGTVVKPFNEDTPDDATDTRYIKSGDYYLGHLPAVYMRQAESIVVTEEAGEPKYKTKWDATFRDMDKYVLEKTVFAIKLPDQYGPYKLPADYYNSQNGTSFNPSAAHPYYFDGRFVNESNPLTYSELDTDKYNLLVNTYPANIKASEIKGGAVLIYDFNGGSFRAPNWKPVNGENTSLILSQHGFAYKPNSDRILEIPATAFDNTNTLHRSNAVSLPEIRVMAKNDNYTFNSDVKISIDELKQDIADPNVDASKLFTTTEKKVPELYVIRYNDKWAGVTIPNADECIPLGLRMMVKNQTVTLSLNKVDGIDTAILEDRQEGKQYDLLAGEKCTVSGLAKGDCEGRFFLNLGVSEEDEEDNEVPTEIEEELSSESGIMIFSNSEGFVVSCSSDINLQTIYVNDMSGKTAKYSVSGQYAEIKLPVAQGVYTVNVIGDTASKVGKVILK